MSPPRWVVTVCRPVADARWLELGRWDYRRWDSAVAAARLLDSGTHPNTVVRLLDLAAQTYVARADWFIPHALYEARLSAAGDATTRLRGSP
ncbi:MAG: hypothetical protein L3K23_10380 [Thermoplasmata archaeon]|nr:hypothetical protein [Thermoplasmata archaeon]